MIREFLVIMYDKQEKDVGVERIHFENRKPKRSEVEKVVKQFGATFYEVEEEIFKKVKRFHGEG